MYILISSEYVDEWRLSIWSRHPDERHGTKENSAGARCGIGGAAATSTGPSSIKSSAFLEGRATRLETGGNYRFLMLPPQSSILVMKY